MNPPDPSGPDGRLPRLAGFADGELDETVRREVAGWVEEYPTVAEILRDQEQLSPANAEFWAAVELPQPAEPKWEAARRAVAARLMPRTVPVPISSRRTGRVALAVAAVAAAVLVGWLSVDGRSGSDAGPVARPGERSPAPAVAVAPMPREVSADPLADIGSLTLAGPSDVLIEAVRGETPAGGFGADAPAPDRLTLAGPGEVAVIAVRPGPGGGMPRPGLTTAPGDAPMIYAAGPRTR